MGYLDRHLVIPLLEFHSVKSLYDEDDLVKARLDILSQTRMVDFYIEEYKKINPNQEIPEEMTNKRKQVVEEYRNLQDETRPLLEMFQDPKVSHEIQNSRDAKTLQQYLASHHNFKPEWVDTCYNYAKCLYEIGTYEDASEYLYFHRVLCSPSDPNYLNGLWGKLASDILMQKWDQALEDLKRLQQHIDESTFGSSLQTLHQKQYLNAIQTTCPWILRYLSTAVVINKNSRRNVMLDLVKVIQEESYTYKDPITSFIEDLYVNFNFDGAQQKLRQCEEVLESDFFLVSCLNDFIENSRLMIFETFCRIHQCISISMLAEKLNMGTEEAERWIVNLIRNAKLDAKIDSQQGHVVMGTQTTSPYEQLIERTKALSFRSQMLQLNVEKKKKAQDQPNWGTDGF